MDRSKTQPAQAQPGLSRRNLLGIAGTVAVAAVVGLPATTLARATALPRPKPVGGTRVLRVAHLTDSHIQPELRATDGMNACLQHVMAQSDKVGLVVTGGDLIMDSFGQPRERTQTQWNLYTRSLKDHCGVPVEHCLGNHDIWGWDKKKSQTAGTESQWGKKWACDVLGLATPYRAFERAGWRFVVLDSVQPFEAGYLGGIEEAQFEWFKAELEAHRATPTIVVSHVPIVSAVACLGDGKFKDGVFSLSGGNVFTNQLMVHSLLRKHPQVKACISGHIHQLEDMRVEGVRYICDGAVSGAWWKGEKTRCVEGYGLLDLFDDGRVDWKYETYGWKAE